MVDNTALPTLLHYSNAVYSKLLTNPNSHVPQAIQTSEVNEYNYFMYEFH